MHFPTYFVKDANGQHYGDVYYDARFAIQYANKLTQEAQKNKENRPKDFFKVFCGDASGVFEVTEEVLESLREQWFEAQYS